MRICRFAHPDLQTPRYGVVEDRNVRALREDQVFSHHPPTDGVAYPLAEVRLLSPVSGSKVVCVGRNYVEHAAELGNPMPTEPLLFLKAPSAIIGPEDAIELPTQSHQVEHEGELGVVIRRMARRLSNAADPLDYVLGYTCVNDITARDLQRKDVQFTRAKSFDTFCPVGPLIVTDLNPLDLEVATRVNGQLKQKGRTSQMAFNVPFLIRYISHAMTLHPGDLIATGTPAGVSPLRPGDTVEVEIEGIGLLRNQVWSLESEVHSPEPKDH